MSLSYTYLQAVRHTIYLFDRAYMKPDGCNNLQIHKNVKSYLFKIEVV